MAVAKSRDSGIGGIIAKTNLCSVLFPTDRAYIVVQVVVVTGRVIMDYKEKILLLLEKVKSENTLKRVYKLLEYLYLKEK